MIKCDYFPNFVSPSETVAEVAAGLIRKIVQGKEEFFTYAPQNTETGTALLGTQKFFKPIDDVSLEIKTRLGTNVAQRLADFTTYSKGWYMGKGEPLSKLSIAQMERFVRRAMEYLPDEPSIFMSEDGFLQLQWENSDGTETEVGFYPDHFEYYIESTDEEGQFSTLQLSELISRIF